jgi:S-adenosylmethionine synthetase
VEVRVNGLFTSESVTEGHPDKVADQISDAILDACLEQDPKARVACETLVAPGRVVLAGEITTSAQIDRDAIVRKTLARIGYDDPTLGFDAEHVTVTDHIGEQSAEIAAGVDRSLEARSDSTASAELLVGAGDQGMMFGYASDETTELLPLPIALAHQLARRLAAVRHDGTIRALRPDGKTQVTVRYDEGHPVAVERIVVSAHHSPELGRAELHDALRTNVVAPVVSERLLCGSDLDGVLMVNPAGRFTLGGPAADAGLTGRKIVVDTYGGMAPHGGGAFSGKDPSKVDRSAAYGARHVARTVVAAGLASRCLVQIAFAIGAAEPVSLLLDTSGTGRLDDRSLAKLVRQVFDLRPGAFRRALDLHRPIYTPTATYGHFGRRDLDLPWEREDRVADLRQAAQS